ncbi:hypothetical protein CHISP_1047 [Chitinispirillum alkaliphilum]|nr:hypothetical protein CHISP_1047 [Chitinispirillum alkaliphilum]
MIHKLPASTYHPDFRGKTRLFIVNPDTSYKKLNIFCPFQFFYNFTIDSALSTDSIIPFLSLSLLLNTNP